ncbi:pentapeptide repeat-containing protein [Nonomuraea sp. NPDC049141]|uniref:pentapeptide repeat-containing protein n=1 Tax=Nonomuraea sp. NPDC049141 TaxID=3155500 RepID=UPI00340B00CC
MKPVSIVVAAAGLALVAGIVWVLGPGAHWVLEHMDGVAIGGSAGLAGKDLAAALDAVRGRVLAVATGLAALVAVYYTARNADTARRTFQLGERGHVTDRYGKAVEQLGSAQAPVRLGGLHALEQLAQDNPAPEFRQTIVDVICAYLRMPYTSPPDETGRAEPAVPRATIGGVSAPAGRDPHEERQVRLTAQRILTAHLRYQDPPARRRWQPHSADPNARHWAGIRLDLTGATLLDFDLSRCRVGDAAFGRAAFAGDAGFEGAAFAGGAGFEGATFAGGAGFEGATFTGDAEFRGATFTRAARFGWAAFAGDAGFEGATFAGGAWFTGVAFTGYARFDSATFSGAAGFDRVTFTGYARFDSATFTGYAEFRGATFTRAAAFGWAAFSGYARFDIATFSGDAGFAGAAFSGAAGFTGTTFSGAAAFRGATGLERAELDGARVAPSAAGVQRVWPPCWRVVAGADGWQRLRLARPEAGGGEVGEVAGQGPAGEGGGGLT